MERYGAEWKERCQLDEDLREVGSTHWEWRRLLRMCGHTEPFEVLCCPEDINCKEAHGPEVICGECDVPICSDCYRRVNRSKDAPMALANDNMWGYIASVIMQYQV